MQGKSVFKGIVIAKPFIYKKEALVIDYTKIKKEEVEEQKQVYYDAFEQTKKELEFIKKETSFKIGKEEAEIFEAHLTMLQDPLLKNSIIKYVEELFLAEAAAEKARSEVEDMFKNIPDLYIQARIADVNDVVIRLIRNIKGIKEINLSKIDEPVIIITEDLTPSDTAQMSHNVKGIITEIGSETSHTAIMAKAMGIPAMVGVEKAMVHYGNGEVLILDTIMSKIILNPTNTQIEDYSVKIHQLEVEKERLLKLKDKEALTRDGHQIQMYANIGNEKELEYIKAYGAEGIGLLRTEFIYMNSKNFPTEEEQYKIYRTLAEKGGEEVIIRTLDIGGDKQLAYFEFEKEMNPFLGYRAIRLCLDRTDIFRTQLRALLRASAYGPIKIMYPMISSVEEVREANGLLEYCKEELRKENQKFNEDIEVGIMIEIPSAAMIADVLINEVDFFSIGTNDLCQYTLAVDRMNQKVSHLYEPLHPAILRLIYQTVLAAHKVNKKVGVCGEMAGNTVNSVILVGLGVDELSMSASSIPYVKEQLRSIRYEEARTLGNQVINCATVKEVREIIEDYLSK